MSVDLTPYIFRSGVCLASEACLGNQPGEPAAHNDCVPISVQDVLSAMGYPTTDPQTVINGIFGSGSSAPGGTTFDQVWAWYAAQPSYPSLPPWARVTLDEPSLEAALNQGFPVLIFGNVDCASVEFVAGGACAHASVLSYCDATSARVINAFWNQVETYDLTQLLASLFGAIVIQRSVLPPPPTPQVPVAVLVAAGE